MTIPDRSTFGPASVLAIRQDFAPKDFRGHFKAFDKQVESLGSLEMVVEPWRDVPTGVRTIVVVQG